MRLNSCDRMKVPPLAARRRVGREAMRGKRMSRDVNSILKPIAAFGLLGLVLSLCAPPSASAGNNVVAFSAAVYANRYVCSYAYDEDFFTAVSKYNPNGTGGYSAGTLIAADNAFVTTSPGQTGFCTYTLNTSPTSSFYTISGQGIGFEKLTWVAATSNDPSCPATFTDQTAIVLRNLANSNGIVVDAEVSDDNLLGLTVGSPTSVPPITAILAAGRGFCLK
jgi:hypothetical protein